MRIGLNNTPDPRDVSTDRTSTLPVSPQAAGKAGSQSDSFSVDTVSVSSLAARALEHPEIRADKVDNLRQQIANGEYRIDPRAIAEAMLRN
jgi:negative regulator of flagellin synthesis FlgM